MTHTRKKPKGLVLRHPATIMLALLLVSSYVKSKQHVVDRNVRDEPRYMDGYLGWLNCRCVNMTDKPSWASNCGEFCSRETTVKYLNDVTNKGESCGCTRFRHEMSRLLEPLNDREFDIVLNLLVSCNQGCSTKCWWGTYIRIRSCVDSLVKNWKLWPAMEFKYLTLNGYHQDLFFNVSDGLTEFRKWLMLDQSLSSVKPEKLSTMAKKKPSLYDRVRVLFEPTDCTTKPSLYEITRNTEMFRKGSQLCKTPIIYKRGTFFNKPMKRYSVVDFNCCTNCTGCLSDGQPGLISRVQCVVNTISGRECNSSLMDDPETILESHWDAGKCNVEWPKIPESERCFEAKQAPSKIADYLQTTRHIIGKRSTRCKLDDERALTEEKALTCESCMDSLLAGNTTTLNELTKLKADLSMCERFREDDIEKSIKLMEMGRLLRLNITACKEHTEQVKEGFKQELAEQSRKCLQQKSHIEAEAVHKCKEKIASVKSQGATDQEELDSWRSKALAAIAKQEGLERNLHIAITDKARLMGVIQRMNETYNLETEDSGYRIAELERKFNDTRNYLMKAIDEKEEVERRLVDAKHVRNKAIENYKEILNEKRQLESRIVSLTDDGIARSSVSELRVTLAKVQQRLKDSELALRVCEIDREREFEDCKISSLQDQFLSKVCKDKLNKTVSREGRVGDDAVAQMTLKFSRSETGGVETFEVEEDVSIANKLKDYWKLCEQLTKTITNQNIKMQIPKNVDLYGANESDMQEKTSASIRDVRTKRSAEPSKMKDSTMLCSTGMMSYYTCVSISNVMKYMKHEYSITCKMLCVLMSGANIESLKSTISRAPITFSMMNTMQGASIHKTDAVVAQYLAGAMEACSVAKFSPERISVIAAVMPEIFMHQNMTQLLWLEKDLCMAGWLMGSTVWEKTRSKFGVKSLLELGFSGVTNDRLINRFTSNYVNENYLDITFDRFSFQERISRDWSYDWTFDDSIWLKENLTKFDYSVKNMEWINGAADLYDKHIVDVTQLLLRRKYEETTNPETFGVPLVLTKSRVLAMCRQDYGNIFEIGFKNAVKIYDLDFFDNLVANNDITITAECSEVMKIRSNNDGSTCRDLIISKNLLNWVYTVCGDKNLTRSPCCDPDVVPDGQCNIDYMNLRGRRSHECCVYHMEEGPECSRYLDTLCSLTSSCNRDETERKDTVGSNTPYGTLGAQPWTDSNDDTLARNYEEREFQLFIEMSRMPQSERKEVAASFYAGIKPVLERVVRSDQMRDHPEIAGTVLSQFSTIDGILERLGAKKPGWSEWINKFTNSTVVNMELAIDRARHESYVEPTPDPNSIKTTPRSLDSLQKSRLSLVKVGDLASNAAVRLSMVDNWFKSDPTAKKLSEIYKKSDIVKAVRQGQEIEIDKMCLQAEEGDCQILRLSESGCVKKFTGPDSTTWSSGNVMNCEGQMCMEPVLSDLKKHEFEIGGSTTLSIFIFSENGTSFLEADGTRDVEGENSKKTCVDTVMGDAIPITLTSVCEVDVTTNEGRIDLRVRASGTTKLTIHARSAKPSEKIIWMRSGEEISEDISHEYEREVAIDVVCNNRYYRDIYSLTKRDYCLADNTKRGIFGKLSSLLCLNSRRIYFLVGMFFVLLLMFFFSTLAEKLFAIVLTFCLVPFNAAIRLFFTKTCMNCLANDFRWRKHYCDTKCNVCGTELMTTEEEQKLFEEEGSKFFPRTSLMERVTMLNNYFRRVKECQSKKSDLIKHGDVCPQNRGLEKVYTVLSGIMLGAHVAAKVAKHLAGAVWLILILIVMIWFLRTAEAAPTSPVGASSDRHTLRSEVMMDLSRAGFKVDDPDLMSKMGLPQALHLDNVKKTCDQTGKECYMTGSVMMNIKARKGFSQSFEVISKHGPVPERKTNITVFIANSEYIAPSTEKYMACESDVVTLTENSCYEGCEGSGKTYDDNRRLLKEKIGLDGNARVPVYTAGVYPNLLKCPSITGCAELGTGCYSISCMDIRRPESCHRIIKTNKGWFSIKLCVYYYGSVYCVDLTNNKQVSTETISMALNSQDPIGADVLYAVSKTGEIRSGAINDRGEYSSKFGKPQFRLPIYSLEEDPTLYTIGDCGTGDLCAAWHHCILGHNGYMKRSCCCINTYNQLGSLKLETDKVYRDGHLRIQDVNSGSTTVVMRLKYVEFKGITENAQISSVSMKSLKGCFSCDHASILTVSATSSGNAHVSVSCEGDLFLKSDVVFVTKGTNEITIEAIANKETVSAKCMLANRIFSVSGKLEESEFLYHTKFIGQKTDYHTDHDCTGLFCDLFGGLSDLFTGAADWWKTLITYIVVVGVAVALIWLLVPLVIRTCGRVSSEYDRLKSAKESGEVKLINYRSLEEGKRKEESATTPSKRAPPSNSDLARRKKRADQDNAGFAKAVNDRFS